jgi:endonuclease YncB( thermonuclease family)
MMRLAAAFALAFATPALAAKPRYTFTGRVVHVTDGDTLTVLDNRNVQHKIRLAGIDAPERSQPFGSKARESLAAKVFRREVRVEVVDADRYGREVGRIFVFGRLINAEMVRDGFAWRYPQWDPLGEYASPEAEARRYRRGLWVDNHPVPPWEFRKLKRAVPSVAHR